METNENYSHEFLSECYVLRHVVWGSWNANCEWRAPTEEMKYLQSFAALASVAMSETIKFSRENTIDEVNCLSIDERAN